MLAANKHLLPILGLDVHVVILPPPAPPTPIPHPFVGITFDLIDYIPFFGSTVNINFQPRGVSFTNGLLGTKKHIALTPTLNFAVPPIIGHNSFNFFGSKTVKAQGSLLSPSGYQVMSCNDVGVPLTLSPPPGKGYWPPVPALYLPTSQTVPIPGGFPVNVGGPYVPDLMGMLKMLAFSYLFGCLFKKGLEALAKKFPKLKCFVFGDPVNAVTGSVVYETTDFEIPGPLPVKWERRWYSDSDYEGPLGHGTHHSYDLTLFTDYIKNSILIVLSDGRLIEFPLLLNEGDSSYNRQEKLTLLKFENGTFKLKDHQNQLTYIFIKTSIDTFKPGTLANLNGFNLKFIYSTSGNLKTIVDSVGRNILLNYDKANRIINVRAEYKGYDRTFITYDYNENNDLSVITDAMDKTTYVRFANHLMVEKTDRNGQTFYWEYEGTGINAKCTHTWGDNGLLENKATYKKGYTEVINSLGEKTIYYYNNINLVTKIIDPLGNSKEFVYTNYTEIYREIDEEGNITGYTYDDRGNTKTKQLADNSIFTYIYDDDGQLQIKMDAQNQLTVFHYNENKLLRNILSPDGSMLSLTYNNNNQLASVTNKNKETTFFEYDKDYNLSKITLPGGSNTQWTYDTWGRCTRIISPENKPQFLNYDELDRVIKVKKFDGNVVNLKYDAYEEILTAEDKHYKVEFTYNALGSILKREQNGTNIRFKYDTENRLIGISNEFNEVYHFQRNARGDIIKETGFDGVTRDYERDRAGKLIRTNKPGDKWTTYEYDQAGRLARAEHSDKTWQTYSYNRNGHLIEACNEISSLQIKRDAVGRAISEICGEHWVKSAYDITGKKINITSSFGIEINHEYNKEGTINKTAVGINESPKWEAKFKYNQLGLETERGLPGGVQKIFEYDAAGNPIKEKVKVKNLETLSKRYSWDVNYRLTQVVNEITKGITTFGHDEFGNLAWAQYENKELDYRMPDAAGNLYKTKERKDRKYGHGGRLLESDNAFYKYDAEGNLIEKNEKNGKEWRYYWDGNGMLMKVIRPDGKSVQFEYDALGRRLSKTFNGIITRWLWNGNIPLHEWKYAEKEKPQPVINEFGEVSSNKKEPLTNLISWLFDEGSFKPSAKIDGQNVYSIITDYLGTPIELYNDTGQKTWQADYDIRGKVRKLGIGSLSDCPFRYQGQYEDAETGLYYNRFRYYDCETGCYIKQDMIGIASGEFNLYLYVSDTNYWVDVFGMTCGSPNANQRKMIDELRAGRDVRVRSIEEARALLEHMPELRPHVDKFPKWAHSSNIEGNRFGDLWKQPPGTYRGDLFPSNENLFNQGVIHNSGNATHDVTPHYNLRFQNGAKSAILIDN